MMNHNLKGDFVTEKDFTQGYTKIMNKGKVESE